MKVCFTAIASLMLYGSTLIVRDAYSSGSTFWDGLGHGVFFGTFLTILTFPILVGMGFFLRWATELILQRPMPYRTILPWFIHVPLILVYFPSAIQDPPITLFRRYVADDVPSSLSEFRHWRTSGIGNAKAIMSFRIAPAEFSKVLSRHQYTEHSKSEEVQPLLLLRLINERPNFPISLPNSPLVYEYRHSEPGLGGGLHVSHYTTQAKDFVITIWIFD